MLFDLLICFFHPFPCPFLSLSPGSQLGFVATRHLLQACTSCLGKQFSSSGLGPVLLPGLKPSGSRRTTTRYPTAKTSTSFSTDIGMMFRTGLFLVHHRKPNFSWSCRDPLLQAPPIRRCEGAFVFEPSLGTIGPRTNAMSNYKRVCVCVSHPVPKLSSEQGRVTLLSYHTQ